MFVEKNTSNRLNEVFEMKLGRILSISQQHSKRDDDKRLWARIEVFPSGTYDDVPFWGGGVDFDTGMPHGIFVPPRENQTIIVFFLNGNYRNPVGIMPVPHPYDYSFVDQYYNILESVDDIALFHYSGSRIVMREDGSIDIQKRIEESPDTFVNHTLKIEFEYDDGNNIRKKTITDIDNDVIVEITTDDVKITDAADQTFNMHHKAGEEKVEIIDKSGQKLSLDSTNGSEKTLLEKSGTQKMEMTSTSTDITAPLLNLLAANEKFLKGTTWNTNWITFNAAVQAATPGSTAQNAAAITAIKTAFGVFAAQLNNMLSTKILGE